MEDHDANMQPLQAFVDRYVKCEWLPKEEFIIHNSELTRFRIIVERANQETLKDGFLGIWRAEKLADRGIDSTCSDAKEFADQLLNTMFDHLSPHEIMHLIARLQEYIDEWHNERKAAFLANPKVFGNYVPTEDEKFCQG